VTVRDLLTASMMAHNAAKPKGRQPRPSGWRELIQEASRLRQEALNADPDRRDLAWSDFGNHDKMTAFYSDVLKESK
jgi:hypothetical protein